MDFYYRKDTGFLWPKRSEPTEREQQHLAGASGLVPWGIFSIDETNATMIDHALAGHCLCDDGRVYVTPESEWPENRGEE